MDQRLYIRLRGRVQGPFEVTKLRELVRLGQLSTIHQVSEDKVEWLPASTYSELFPASESAVPSAVTKPVENESSYEFQAGNNANNNDWYYTLDGVQQTPVALSILKRLVESGKVSADSLVWREGMNDWTSASDLSQFSNSISKSMESVSGRSQSQFSDIERTLKDSRSWIVGIAVCLYIAGALLLISGAVSIVMGVKVNNPIVTISGFNSALVAGVLLWIAQLITSINIRIGRFIANKQIDRLDAVLVSLKTLWIFVCIVLILLFVDFLIFSVWIFSIGIPLLDQVT